VRRRRATPRARGLLAAFFLLNGAHHFLNPRVYDPMVPRALPAPRAIVYASGVAELAGGAGVLSPRAAPAAGWWLIATLVAVFPANVNMAVNAGRFRAIPEPLLWARLPVQGLFIAWVWKVAVRGTQARVGPLAWLPGRRPAGRLRLPGRS
jgi:uncharacterized membrane protein